MRIEWIEDYMKEAEQLIAGEQVEKGLSILNSLLYDEPGYASLHNHIGWVHLYYTSNLAQAELHFKVATSLLPELAPPYLHLGTLYVRTERTAEALEVLTTGLTRPGANRAGLLELAGHAYELRHEFGKAIKAYREASMASMNTLEMNNISEGIRRCRKKRWIKLIG
jgi:tetratricopeptide (TPR) repeat protein